MVKAKFTIQELLGVGLTLIVLSISIGYGLEIAGDVEEDACDGSLEHYDDSNCMNCPNSTYNTYEAYGNTCNNGTATFNASATQGGNVQFNATNSAINGIAKIPEKLPTIATVIVASVIIGILVTYMWGRFSN